MRRSSLLHFILAAALLAGLAHLRSDWLSGGPERPEPPHAAKPAPAAKAWSARRDEPHVRWSFLRR